MTRERTEKQRAHLRWCIEQSVERGRLLVEHRCDGCGTTETFERKQFRKRGWNRAWTPVKDGVRTQIELCPTCREARRVAAMRQSAPRARDAIAG